jgi:hypothetical protein
MDWQMWLTVSLVGVAGTYLIRRGWRTWRASQKGCSGGCGCAKATAAATPPASLIPADQLVIRRSR